MIEGSLYTFLSNISEITDIVDDRIHVTHSVENVYPSLVYSLVSNTDDMVLAGASGSSRARIQFDAYSYNLADCLTITEAIRDNLQGFKGTLGTTVVMFAKLTLEQDMSEVIGDKHLYRRSADYLLRYVRSIPTP